ncbi:uncharacterized protein BKA55DRAFT_682800 [Fusarium redolens]|uniref:Uncharacterized protein n=1 Tax=Fusarium redolens TaxID=48865 RepID=A0A9P9KW92_FUSRE|nr:uncharacterized protein BKA55DRAFT_682800 [Fusarium redolens]KAH7269717.1 hypothetical protein BKA55DRAFT_682800 [Fusarium redolens]
MNTPSADIMSSPDPLNDTVEQSVMPPPSTRRVIRSSQRSSRFSSMGLGTSPRKQTFELEVGDNKAPQKLLVTVETEEPSATAGPSSARRKLFQDSPYLPISRRREMATTTTTTVPLKGAIEDDTNATPRKRGRPRKTNGTPLPSAGTKRKSITPMHGSPRRRQRTTKDIDTPNKSADSNAQPTPGTKRRGRPPKNRPVDPPNAIEDEQNARGVSETSNRSESQALDKIEVAGDASDLPSLRADDSQADNDVTLVITPSEAEANQLRANRTANNSAPAQQSEPDSDIWMATLDDEPTPRPGSRATQNAPVPSSPDHGRADGSSDFGDYGFGPAGSDVSSADEPESDTRPGNEDTVAAGEDFSMIFMDSLPSLQASMRSSVREIAENDIGEETSLIINNTLESLRQSLQDRDRPNANKETAEQDKEAQPPAPAPVEPRDELRQSTIRPPMTFSPNRNLSSIWRQTPRRMGSSPLRRQVLQSNARDNPDVEYRGSPLATQRQDSSHLETDNSNLYDDSFSEIPDAVLEAATPRRPRATAKKAPSEREDIEMGDADLIQFDDEPQQVEIQQEEQVVEEQGAEAEQEAVEEQEQQEAEPLAASIGSAVSRSDGGRLPTPDDTPPNIDLGNDNNQKSTSASQSPARSASSRDSSLRNSSPAPAPQAQLPPETIEVDDEVVDQAVEVTGQVTNEAVVEVEELADNDNDPIMDLTIMPEPDDHSDPDDQPLEETILEDLVEEGPEGAEEIPEIVVPQQPRLSLEAEMQQPEVTPLNQLTSPIQEPQSLPDVPPERVRRPTLSPIMRAGRALQSVTSDPPTPEARDHHLRSPFRRSASRELGPRGTQPNLRTSASPGKSRPFTETAQIPKGDEVYDDPFGTNTRHTGQASFMEALERRSAGSSPRHRRTMSRESAASSTHFQVPSEGGMSWVDREGPISDNLRGDVPLEAFARSTARSSEPQSISHGQLDGTVNDADDETEDAGDDMDLWEFEAQRSSPHAARQPSPARKPESPIRRRSNLPSPWRRQANRGTQRPPTAAHQTRNELEENEEHLEEDTAPQPDDMEVAQNEPSQAEEYSLVTQREVPQESNKAPATAKANRFDLSSFFSSPAAIPGMLADKLSPLKKMSVFGARPSETEPEPTETDRILPTSSMFPQLPQQELVPRGQPRAGFFSPIRPAQSLARRGPSEEPENDEYSRSDSRSNMSLSGRQATASPRQEEHEASMQEISDQRNDESEQQEELDEEGTEILEEEGEDQLSEQLPSVSQKMNFTPQRRTPSQSFFKASTQTAAPAAPGPGPILSSSATTPPRMQLTHADIQKWQQQTSNASEDSPERPPARPLLRPLPPKNASPIKSSLRSPLKPHTPGRVVEFTSSVLSPIEQAKVRHQRRLSNSSAASQSSTGAQRPRVRPPPQQTANKENNTIPQIPISNEKLPTKQTHLEPLSQTVWTRRHWLLLDALLQQRRQGPFRLHFERYSDQYLGKTVASQGESMTLERWHLDCVDAFKAQVGGWDEAALVKRLFALILGEEKRSRGAGKPARVMFH